jgi:ribonucleoside-diphosphate reductase alpha chain
LSDIVAFRTYAKFLPHLGRRESFEETINRNMSMHLDRFPKLSKEILKAYSHVHSGYVMPSMRGMQFAGEAVLKNNIRLYNCSFANIDDIRVFGEAVFILLSGAGFGFSVQQRHVSKLPKITGPREEGIFTVQDSISGWAQAIDTLIESYMLGRVRPSFDFSHIRPKGSYLVTTGAKAPGPEPLKRALELVEMKLKSAIGRRLSSIEVYDIVCILSDAVYAGGIRRAALICLFDKTDEEMLRAKQGDWWVKTPWRARSNNSALLLRSETSKEEFEYVFNMCKNSGSGEPGFSWTNNLDHGYNPCHEIYLNPMQFCNLTTVNQTGITTEKHLMDRVHAAVFLGTLQATYTDFPYLRPGWKEITEKEALLGVSFTGVADNINFITPT